MEQCTRKSLLYENIFGACNPDAGSKEEVKGSNGDIPTIYVGETSRTVQERAVEHWAAVGGSKKAREGSHMAKHVEQYHKGEDPLFYMRVVSFHRTALSRQTAEAVRIRRRGGEGAVLNSKAEFNRCYLPRLKLVGEQESTEMEQAEEQADEAMREQLREGDSHWEHEKTRQRSSQTRGSTMVGSSKRSSREQLREGKPSKRRKFALVEQGWGTKTTVLEAKNEILFEEQDEYNKEEEQESSIKAGEQPTSEELVDGGGATPIVMVENHPPTNIDPLGVDSMKDGHHHQPSSEPTHEMGGRDEHSGSSFTGSTDEKVEDSHVGDSTNEGGGGRVYEAVTIDLSQDGVVRTKTDMESTTGEQGDRSIGIPAPSMDSGVETNEMKSSGMRRPGDRSMMCDTTPSSDGMMNQYDRVRDGCGDEGTKCVIESRKCITHGCMTREIRVSAKRWVKNKKTGIFGWRTSKETKQICKFKNGGLESDSSLGPIETRLGENYLALKGEKNIQSQHNILPVSAQDERESSE